MRNSFTVKVYLRDNAAPSKFKWCPESPRKQKAPAVRLPSRPATEKTKRTKSSTSTKTCSSSDSSEERKTQQEANGNELKKDVLVAKLNRWSLTTIFKKKLHETGKRINALENENTVLLEKSAAAEKKLESTTERVFDLDKFERDKNISFSTGFPKYATFVATSEFLNLGDHAENT